MQIIPAIDVKDGHCVRLKQGEMHSATVFSEDPAAMAQHWLEQGAQRLHLVDLNGAVAGVPKNELAIREIVSVIGEEIPVQLGGGIRDLDTIERYLDDGITYVIIGTAAVKNPGFLHDACYAFPGHIIVGLDARDGKVATDGWSKMTGHDVVDLGKKFEDYGVEAIIYTDIGRDGMLTGVNVEATVKLARAIRIPVIASGGIASIDDILKLVPFEKEGIIGAIAGRALYEGKLDFKAAHEGAPRAAALARHRLRAPSGLMGLAKRIIPCLDVAEGRVVKGVNFVNLRDAGDPVEVARRYDEQGADELAFLDIRASVETRGLLYHMIEAVADEVFIPLTVGGGVNSVDDIRALLNAGADKVSINTAGVQQPGAVRGGRRALRRAVHRRGDRRQAGGAGGVGGVHARRAHADRPRRGGLGARGRRPRRRRDPAHQHGSRRRAHRVRPGADAGGGRRGRRAGDRVGRRGLAAGPGRRHLEGGADAVLAASIFHYGEFTIAQAKAAMAAAGIEMRA